MTDLSKIIQVKKITTAEEFNAAVEAAKKDNDAMRFPTHAIYKGDKIVGTWNLGGIPLVMLWHDSKAFTARDNIMLNPTMDGIMNDRGHKQYFMACNSHSPYYKVVERFGFSPPWATNLFYKDIFSSLKTVKEK